MTSARYRLATCAALIGLAVASHPAAAQSYPAKPVRVIVPFPPAGATDLAARIISDHLARAWSQPVVADFRAGATGLIASETLARSAPDGYSLLLALDSTTAGAAFKDITVPVDGDFRLWVRYEYPPFTDARFEVEIVQGGRSVAKKQMGAKDNDRFAFGVALADLEQVIAVLGRHLADVPQMPLLRLEDPVVRSLDVEGHEFPEIARQFLKSVEPGKFRRRLHEIPALQCLMQNEKS